MVEIAKAFLSEVRLLILDEPTASLTEAETQNLFALVARLKTAGVGIIYVSHRIQEFQKIGDRITVLRDGRKIATVKSGDVSENELVELMTGRKVGVLFPAIDHRPGEKLLEVDDVTLADLSARNVNFYARAGEITGIAGLVGCGKSEIVRAIYGLEPIASGVIRVRRRGDGGAPGADRHAAARRLLFSIGPRRRRLGARTARPRKRLDGGARPADILAARTSCGAQANDAPSRRLSTS